MRRPHDWQRGGLDGCAFDRSLGPPSCGLIEVKRPGLGCDKVPASRHRPLCVAFRWPGFGTLLAAGLLAWLAATPASATARAASAAFAVDTLRLVYALAFG